MEDLDTEAQRLLHASLAKSTHSTYNRGIDNFEKFRMVLGLQNVWPAPVQHVINYVSHLSLQGKAPSTIDTYIAALAYIHKINGWINPTDNFIIKKLREGCRRQTQRVDGRCPITLPILTSLLGSLPSLCSSSFEVALFKASFSLAFFGFLRVGELAAASKTARWDNILLPSDVSFANDFSSLYITVRSSKTDQRGRGTALHIKRGPSVEICPVAAMSCYLEARPNIEGPLFIHFGGLSLTTYQFSSMLKKGIKLAGLNPGDFSAHSFRIGAATSAAIEGVPLESIMELGRWRSSAVNLYIRPSLIRHY